MRPLASALWLLPAFIAFVPGVRVLNAPASTALLGLFCVVGFGAILVALSRLASRRKPLAIKANWTFAVGVLFLAVQLISVLRGYLYSASPDVQGLCLRSLIYFAMAVFAAVIMRTIASRSSIRVDLFTATHKVIWWYCAVNLALWVAGVKNPTFVGAAEESSQILSFFGVSAQRVQFPMAWGVNSFGIIAGVSLAVTLVEAAKQRAIRRLLLSATVPLLCLFLSDSRAAIVISILSYLAAISPRWSFRSILVFWGMGLALVVFAEYLPAISIGIGGRGGGSVFTSREFIWAIGVAQLSDWHQELIFGYGMFGQFESGASQLYEIMFKEFTDRPELISLHNTYLQSGMDTGYVGLAVLFLFLVLSIRSLANLARRLDWTYSGALAAMIFLTLNGLTEVTVSLYQPWVALLLVAVVAMFRRRDITTQPALDPQPAQSLAFAGR